MWNNWENLVKLCTFHTNQAVRLQCKHHHHHHRLPLDSGNCFTRRNVTSTKHCTYKESHVFSKASKVNARSRPSPFLSEHNGSSLHVIPRPQKQSPWTEIHHLYTSCQPIATLQVYQPSFSQTIFSILQFVFVPWSSFTSPQAGRHIRRGETQGNYVKTANKGQWAGGEY